MHELGIMQNIVNTVQNYAKENDINKVSTVILEIGRISGVVPQALEFCFDVCSNGTVLEGAKLEIDNVAAVGRCKKCNAEFDLIKNNFCCPTCGRADWEMLSGRELIIKGLEVI